MKNYIYIFFFVCAGLFASFGATRPYAPADQVSVNTNGWSSIVVSNDVYSTQSAVQATFNWIDANFPTNISKTNVYATVPFVTNNYYLASNPSNFLTPAAASNLYYPRQTNPSNYLQVVYGSNIVDYTIQSNDIASNTIVIANIETNYMGMVRIAGLNFLSGSIFNIGTTNMIVPTNSPWSRLVTFRAFLADGVTSKTNNTIHQISIIASVSSDNVTYNEIDNKAAFEAKIIGGSNLDITWGQSANLSFFVPSNWWYQVYALPATNLTGSWTCNWAAVESKAQ